MGFISKTKQYVQNTTIVAPNKDEGRTERSPANDQGLLRHSPNEDREEGLRQEGPHREAGRHWNLAQIDA